MPENERRVLIVEDSLDVQSLLASLLESRGYSVACAESGLEALNLLRTMKALPGLILLDIMMPDMDGYTFRREQEKDASLAKVPVVVMTADGHVHDKALRLGAAAYLKKPFASVQLILDTVSANFAE